MRTQGLDNLLQRGAVMRFGHARDEVLARDKEVVAYNFALAANPACKVELDKLNKERDRLRNLGQQRSLAMTKVQQQMQRIRVSIEEGEKRCVERARLVATTVSRLYANKLFEDKTYDLVMFDEVSMAYVPQVICAAMHATNHLVLVGDFRQLAPIAQGNASSKELTRDVFTYLGIVDSSQTAHYHPWLVMLDEQRRMHPSISAFSSYEFYERLLKDYEGMRAAREGISAESPLPNCPMALVDLRGTACSSMKNRDNSRFNILGALTSFGMALEAAKHGNGSVGVITPYVAQVRLIRAMYADWRERASKEDRDSINIACATVHQFQGSERDVIVLDTVESHPSRRPGILTSSKENGSVDRLVNVAVTRVRGKLVTVSNTSFWTSAAISRDNAFRKLVMHHQTFDKVVSTRGGGLKRLLSRVDFGPNIELFHNEVAELEFIHDVSECSQKVVLSIPDGKLDEPFGTKAAEALREARRRGVEVLMKCYVYTDLPAEWKDLGWQSNDAILPLVIIDGSICWYGMPPSRGRHATQNASMPRATTHLAFRIVGPATVGMVWSLTELDARNVDGSKKSLQAKRKRVKDDRDGTSAYGLDLYLQKYHQCPKCRKPMRLAKGYRSGKFFLKCSSCDQTSMLRKDEVTNYIMVKRVCCPKCGNRITARVSRFGLYIKCDRGHTLKPDEI